MNANNTLQAADPQCNATVHASAGTGKTWLLVTRILRLLLAGARPDSILAVTFTRKAAAEMQERVSGRLHELMCAAPDQLDAKLAEVGITATANTRKRARQLYEEVLFNPYALRTTTFHAFCQELLQRFPLEAGVSPGFELSETTGLLEQQAWDALVTETAGKSGPIATALDSLIAGCDGLGNVQTALRSLLSHRSDWWAWVQGQSDPQAYASRQLEQLLEVDAATDPLAGFPDDLQRQAVKDFAALLGRNTTSTNTRDASTLAEALLAPPSPAEFHAAIKPIFLTQKDEPRSRKASKAQCKRLGEADEQQFITLHHRICADLLAIEDRIARRNTFNNSIAWITAGSQLLTHYQRIKQEQRLLDFSDLEWQACALLNRSQHAAWVQYKLDTRIDHLLVDEFQDTNPTQWQLLLPLLQELAAGNEERDRSVFLVGDTKQSIYSFRRANPALLGEAAQWLDQHLQAEKYPLDASRRSAQAIIDCVNTVFGSEPLKQHISSFNTHTTHLPEVYGRVELLPLITASATPEETTPTELRNPLQTPRPASEDRRYAREGQMIAGEICDLIANDTSVTRDGKTRTLRHGDIIILLRQRTHADAYEKALRERRIPYQSASKGTLLDNIEIRDLECLLNLLISPHDNLALAQVLRSPVFGLDSEQLIPLAAAASGSWYERLAKLAAAQQLPFAGIYAMLERWRALTGRIPVHDLIDRIFHEAEIVPRYAAAFPPALRPRVRASLIRFIELALEIDNGRYPSLPRFLEQLNRLRQSEQDQPDEHAPEEADNDRVRLMTIHGAKGLEAAVIFLADTATVKQAGHAYTALVDWPGDRDRPAHFLLAGTTAKLDSVSRGLLERQAQEALREDANLLYVAMTRARQYLYISGSQPDRGGDGSWYQLVSAALADWDNTERGGCAHATGQAATPQPEHPVHKVSIAVDQRLSGIIPVAHTQVQIAPSRTTPGTITETITQTGDADGRERGIAMHLMLQILSTQALPVSGTLPLAVASSIGREPDDPEAQRWWQEAIQTRQHSAFAFLFEPSRFDQAFNEVPVQYLEGDVLIYGIIDRLVLSGNNVYVIDYKTHRSTGTDTLSELAGNYREQMRLYTTGIAKLWPGMEVRPYLLFTACQELVVMGDSTSA